MILLKIVFYTSVFSIIHSYIFYPLSLKFLLLFYNKKSKTLASFQNEWPIVSTITSVFNEESVIRKKVLSIIQSNYPNELLNIFLGSDASSDRSDQLMEQLQKEYPNIHFSRFNSRRGKTSVINDLMKYAFELNPQSKDHILIFTDANVILDPMAIRNMVRNFSNVKIGLVDSKIIPFSHQSEGIAMAEIKYINFETQIKKWEGELWGVMMGAFGGCFAVRSNLVHHIPTHLITDDFYISMKVLEQNGQLINDIDAICFEGIPNLIEEEFKRKLRISSGNFQCLSLFRHFLYQPPWTRAYAFISHKLLRWLGPIFLFLIYISCSILAMQIGNIYIPLFILVNIFYFLIPTLDWTLSKFNIHIKLFRGVRYFLSMNIALFLGLIKYLRGIKHSVWEPPKRNQI
ncbi:MAG: glycosyltransferase [Saprospiraceae bacterium]|nr:glycosyltransferase [Saprospiraceae bacterium]